jgi:hypothetical protein
MIAHVGGVPVEELLRMAAGASTVLLVARTWVWLRLRPGRAPLKRTPA